MNRRKNSLNNEKRFKFRVFCYLLPANFNVEPIYKLLMDYLQTLIFPTRKQDIETEGWTQYYSKGSPTYHRPLNLAAFLSSFLPPYSSKWQKSYATQNSRYSHICNTRKLLSVHICNTTKLKNVHICNTYKQKKATFWERVSDWLTR